MVVSPMALFKEVETSTVQPIASYAMMAMFLLVIEQKAQKSGAWNGSKPDCLRGPKT